MNESPRRIRRWASACLAVAALLVGPGTATADTMRGSQWALDAHHLNADQVWSLSKGSGVTVAVIDSGVASDHPDLAGQVLPGTSLIGDGDDGRTDTSGDSHGTAIAGIIAATGGPPPGNGVFGLAPAAKILPVRVSAGAEVLPLTLAEGIVWASDHGAQVINVSIGSATPDPMLHKAVDYALAKNIVLVASAGNDGTNGNAPQYPAAFPGVVSVSGIDEAGAFWAHSESGRGITLAAPATDIYSTNDQKQYVRADGTSYAAAFVSAAAALVRAHQPELTAGQVIERLISTADRHHGRPDPRFGYGIVNPLAALNSTAVPGSPDNPLLRAAATRPAKSSRATLTVIAAAIGVIMILVTATTLRLRRRRPPAADPVKPSPTKPARAAGPATNSRPKARIR